MNNKRVDIKQVAAAAQNMADTLVPEWLRDGKRESHEWVALNPTRHDGKAGSFKVNLVTGAWSDFACGDSGGDLVSLYRYLFGFQSQVEAAKALAERVGVQALEAAPVIVAKPEDDWENVRPVPAGAPEMHKAHVKHGHPEMVSEYKDADGCLLGAVMRFRTSTGGKDDIPHTFWRNKKTGQMEWKWRQWSGLRPLYGLDALAAKPDAAVLIVEGEKCKNAVDASEFAGKYATVTWSGGAKAVEKTDWSAITGRHVCLWPDADSQRETLSRAEKEAGVEPESKHYLVSTEQPGLKAMNQIADKLIAQGCTVYMVNIPLPGEWPNGFDIADALEDPSFINVKAYLENAWYIDPEKRSVTLPQAPILDDGYEFYDAPEMYAGPDYGDARVDDGAANEYFDKSLAVLLADYAQLDNKDRAVLKESGEVLNRRQLERMFDKKAVAHWFFLPERDVWDSVKAKVTKKRYEAALMSNDEQFQDVLKRYVLLDGTTDAYDVLEEDVIPLAAVKAVLGREFEDWQNSPHRQVLSRRNYVFDPGLPPNISYNADGSIEWINRFKGLPYTPKPEDLPQNVPDGFEGVLAMFPECKNIVGLVKHLSLGHPQLFEWNLNWLAHRYRFPQEKMATALVFISEVEGAGKSRLSDWILAGLFGDYYVQVGQDALESRFNSVFKDMLMVSFEEISQSDERYNVAGKLKGLITADYLMIESKGRDPVKQKDFSSFIINSNEERSLPLGPTDRRYSIAEAKVKLSPAAYDKLEAEIFAGGLAEFAKLLHVLPLKMKDATGKRVAFTAHTKPLMTTIKKRMQNLNKRGWESFLEDWWQGDIKNVPFMTCEAKDLWELYKYWANYTKSFPLSQSMFYTNIAKRLEGGDGDKRTDCTVDGVKRKLRIMVVPHAWMKAELQGRFPAPNTNTVSRSDHDNMVTKADYYGQQVAYFKVAMRQALQDRYPL